MPGHGEGGPMIDTDITDKESVNDGNTVGRFRFEPGEDASQTRIDLSLLEEALEEFAGEEREGIVHLTVVEDGPAIISRAPDGEAVGVTPILPATDLPDDVVERHTTETERSGRAE